MKRKRPTPKRGDDSMQRKANANKLRTMVFHQIPIAAAVIDRQHRLVDANAAFERQFGEWAGRICYTVIHGRSESCEPCMADLARERGAVQSRQQEGIDGAGQLTYHMVHACPLRETDERADFVVETYADVTSMTRLRLEYEVLFDRVPCLASVLDRDLRIVKANRMVRETFGAREGDHCYSAYKGRDKKCDVCPAEQTFADGGTHVTEQRGIGADGAEVRYVVSTTRRSGVPEQVIELATDVTELRLLNDRLDEARLLRSALIAASPDAILASDEQGRIVIFNQAAERLLGKVSREVLGERTLDDVLPPAVSQKLRASSEGAVVTEAEVTTSAEEVIPVRVAAAAIERGRGKRGWAVFLLDLRPLRKLEREKVEAERLAAVGQTVAGLAHGIKNILSGLEGGLYVVNSGRRQGRADLVDKGWTMLQNNIVRISSLVKDFLSFAKGHTPRVQLVDPNRIVEDVVELYKDAAARAGVSLRAYPQHPMPQTALDAEGIHTCLVNLVSNAVDACVMTDSKQCTVCVRTCHDGTTLVFEVDDDGRGMDYEAKQKVFTSFFTTKGKGGTGLGLLTTRKIASEHGGRVEFESMPGKGSSFQLIFPIDRLPAPSSQPVERGGEDGSGSEDDTRGG
jgi:PAS domain S-box-containing protein